MTPGVLPNDDTGDGRAIVLLHAGVADRTMWSQLTPDLLEAGHRVVAVDLPGFGEAATPSAAPHEEVAATLDHLGIEADAVLVGCSFGAAIGLRVAAAKPQRWRSLLLCSPPPGDDHEPSEALLEIWSAEEEAMEAGDVEAAVAAVVDGWTRPGAPVELRERVAAMQRRAFEHQLAADGVDDLADPIDDEPAALAALDLPTLLVLGADDLADFRESAERLAAATERARLVVVEDAGHLVPLEQPARFAELALEAAR